MIVPSPIEGHPTYISPSMMRTLENVYFAAIKAWIEARKYKTPLAEAEHWRVIHSLETSYPEATRAILEKYSMQASDYEKKVRSG